MSSNFAYTAVQVAIDALVGKTQHGISALPQVCVFAAISSLGFWATMPVQTITLNNQHVLRKGKITKELAPNSVLKHVWDSSVVQCIRNLLLNAGRTLLSLGLNPGFVGKSPQQVRVGLVPCDQLFALFDSTLGRGLLPVYLPPFATVTQRNAMLGEQSLRYPTRASDFISNGGEVKLLDYIQVIQRLVCRLGSWVFATRLAHAGSRAVLMLASLDFSRDALEWCPAHFAHDCNRTSAITRVRFRCPTPFHPCLPASRVAEVMRIWTGITHRLYDGFAAIVARSNKTVIHGVVFPTVALPYSLPSACCIAVVEVAVTGEALRTLKLSTAIIAGTDSIGWAGRAMMEVHRNLLCGVTPQAVISSAVALLCHKLYHKGRWTSIDEAIQNNKGAIERAGQTALEQATARIAQGET